MTTAVASEAIAPAATSDLELTQGGVRLFVLAAVLGVMAAWWASAPYAVGVYHDDGVYVILAKALATGHGFHYLHLPGKPAATHYPPLYPLLLAALWRIAPTFPANVPLFLFANAVLLGAATFGVALFAERVLGWPRTAAAAVALVATLSTPLVMLSGLVLSEPLFVAGLWPLLMAAERVARSDEQHSASVAALGLGIGALALVRVHAVVLVGAVIILLALRRRWRDTILCGAGFVAALVPWQLWLAAHSAPLPDVLRGAYGPYGHWMTEGLRGHAIPFLAATIVINVREVGALFADRFALSDAATPRLIATILATLTIAIGTARLWRRAPVFALFAILYTGVLLAFPYAPWRYLYAVWPVVILCIGASIELGVTTLAPRYPRRLLGLLGGAALLALVLGAARAEIRAYRTRAWQAPAAAATAQIAPIVRWVRSQTRTTDLIASDGEQVVYLFTGRRAIPVAPSTAGEYVYARTAEDNARALRGALRDFPIDYVLTISPELREAADLVVARGNGAAGALGRAPRPATLVPLGPLGAGEAFRTER